VSTIVESQPKESAAPPEWLPAPMSVYRLNVNQYEAIVRAGVFTKRDRLHLINGILVAKTTKKPPHVIACEKTRDALMRAVPTNWRVMVEAPVRIPNYNEPEPVSTTCCRADRDRLHKYHTRDVGRHHARTDLVFERQAQSATMRTVMVSPLVG
jgi:hypothetical protein